MRGPLHVIRRRRAERPANQADAPSGSEATTQVVPVADAAAPTPDPTGSPAGAPAPAGPGDESAQPVPAGMEPEQAKRPSFRERGRMRRRLRYLRRIRELGFRDLGGLAFEQHKFSQVREDLVQAKLAALSSVDAELRALEHALNDRRPITELREPGISACPRCGALHGSDASFCPSCGVPLRGPRAVAGIGEGLSTSVGEIGPVSPVPPSQLTLLTPGHHPAAETPPVAPAPEPQPTVEMSPVEPAAELDPPTTIAHPDASGSAPADPSDDEQPTRIVRADEHGAGNGTAARRPAGERAEP